MTGTRAILLSIAVVVATCGAQAPAAEPTKTFCNPLNLDYGLRKVAAQPSRHGADPVVVLYKDRYYLFSTWDRPGYRVSDDLVNWSYIPFRGDLAAETYTAAAVAQVGDWLYYTEFGRAKRPVAVWRTQHPETGQWEKVSADLPPYADPCLFVDPPTGRLFMYHGLEQPARGVELDPKTFHEMPGTATQLMPKFDPSKPIENGWEVCSWDNSILSKPMRGNGTQFPCREGTWMTLHNGKYFLQFASPGTTVPGYADGALVGDGPLGPFTYLANSPISQKDTGFITSAGHSCLFQDRHGNWWRAVTMLIGVHERFERRIGLYPAGFDKDGIPYTRTDMGDLPITLPTGPRDHLGDVHTRWQVLSAGKVATASSSLGLHPSRLAADEDIRTRWSATSGDSGEWFQLDLGREHDLRALQVNFAEQDCRLPVDPADDVHRFTVSASADGQTWAGVLDRTSGQTCSPHTYAQLEEPVRARYVRVTNVHTPAGGKFAVSDLRVFGVAEGSKPAAVATLAANRDASDRRKVFLRWSPADGASAYLVRYGVSPDKLYQHALVTGLHVRDLTLYSLNHEPPYHFRVDAVNESGVTDGTATAEAP